jgi:hypothetical protein
MVDRPPREAPKKPRRADPVSPPPRASALEIGAAARVFQRR